MVDTNNSNTVELTQEGLNEVNREFAMLSAALGVPRSPEFVYTPEDGTALKVMLDAALRDAQIVLDKGLADGSIVQPAVPLKMLTNEDILAQMLSESSGGTVDVATVLGVINDAEQNISILNQVSGQKLQTTNTVSVTKMVPVNEVPADVQERVMRIENALVSITATLNADDPNANIPAPGTVDGFFDAQSFESYEKTMAYLGAKVAESLTTRVFTFTESMLTDDMIKGAISLSLTSQLAAAKSEPGVASGDADAIRRVSELESSIVALPKLFEDIDFLKDQNALAVVPMEEITVEVPASGGSTTVVINTPGTSGNTPPVIPNTGTPPAIQRTPEEELALSRALEKAEVDGAVLAVETALLQLGGKLDQLTDQFGGIAKSLAGELVTPLTPEEVGGDFGENSQDMTAKLVMMLKTLNGEKNPNGVYTESIGRQLQLSILTKDDFSMVREQFGLEKVTVEEARALIARPPTEVPPLAEGADAAQQTAHTAAMATYNQQKAEYDSSAAKTDKLNVLFHSLDVLRQNDLLNDEKARSTTKMNMIMDGIAGALDNFAPGFKDALKDFFTNSDFGKMIGGMLTMFGININRLWGDKDDSAALKNAAGLVGDGFETAFDKIAADNNLDPKLDFDKIMDLTKDSFQDKMDDFIPSNAMKLMLGDDDSRIKAALADAMDRAAGATDMEGAKQIFVDRLVQIGEAYKNGTGITLLTQVETIGQTVEDVVSERPELAASISSASYMAGAPAVDLPVVTAGETHVELAYDPSTEDFAQDPERFSKGRVATIQDVLHSNAALLGISAVNPDFMYLDKEANEFTDTMTRETCGVFEEVWIRANIHAMVEADTEITQESLDEIANTRLSSENMDVIISYMHDKNVPQADIDAFSQNMQALDGDYNSSANGTTQSSSVFDQALLWGQLTPNIAQWVPQPVVVTADVITPETVVVPTDDGDVTPSANDDPLRDKYTAFNKDRMPCDIPLFYTQEGSDSVFALIRVKSDGLMDNDPSNDTFKVLELENYLNTKSLDNPEHLAAFLDNYNFKNPTKEGVENVINKVLCLEPRVQQAPDVSASPRQEQSSVTHIFNTSVAVHTTPESFRDLRLLDEGKADFLVEKLDLANDRPDIMERAAHDVRHPLDILFSDAIGLQDGRSPFVFLDLKEFGIHNDDFDVVVAMRNGGRVEYRFVDYDTDFIKPLADHRAGGLNDMAENVAPAQGGRRLDDLLRVIERVPGGAVIQGAEGGYSQMSAIIRTGRDEMGLTNGLRAVYGRDMMAHSNQIAYADGITARYTASSSYEYGGPRDVSSPSERQAEFNDRSGHRNGWERLPLIGKFFRHKPEEEGHNSDADIDSNIRDISDGSPYNPNAVDEMVRAREADIIRAREAEAEISNNVAVGGRP